LADEVDPQAALQAEWQVYRMRFLHGDGRIVDTGNGGISHSEGQGWGLLFSEAAGDKEAFDLISAWTATHLKRPHDALHVWRYDPTAADPVADTNNATDGDIFIAWGLARGARRWAQAGLAAAAGAIANDILGKLCLAQSGSLFLLPGAAGFVTPASLTLNLSYYVLPAFDCLAGLAPSHNWAQLRGDGVALIGKAVFGTPPLPPDWLAVRRADLALAPAQPWPPRFGYDAIRVPLWLSWAGLMPPGLGADFAAYWRLAPPPCGPAWIDLRSGAHADYAAPSGMEAVANVTLAILQGGVPEFPRVADAPDYYSASLIMLSRLAAHAAAGRKGKA
jgi:endoglucanase